MRLKKQHRGQLVAKECFTIAPLWCLLAPAYVLADGAGSAPPPQNYGWLVGLLIVYLSRRRAIGGWLLYFYLGVYMGALIQLAFVATSWASLSPSAWDSSARYAIYLVSYVPCVVALYLVVIAATYLLIQRNASVVRLLRLALATQFALTAISTFLDVAYFHDDSSLPLDCITLVSTGIWSLYFWKSKRVRLVFVEHAWTPDAFELASPKPTPKG